MKRREEKNMLQLNTKCGLDSMLSLNIKTLVTFVIFYTTSQLNVKKDLVTAGATRN